MKIVCAWCGKHLGEKEVMQLSQELPPVTHSICPECRKRVFGELNNIPEQSDQTKTNSHRKENMK